MQLSSMCVNIERMKKITTFLFTLCLMWGSAIKPLKAETLLFDAEVMAWLSDMAKPLLQHAHIDPKDVNIYVIQSNEVNAFVTPSKDIFFYSGLILKAEKAEEVQGVLAHEIGHIKGQHYLKNLAHANSHKVPIVLGALLGVGAAALGSGEAATALLSGGLAGTQDSVLRHSRTHEKQADNIAADLLNKEGFSVAGLTSFFSKLQTSHLLYSKTPPAWLLTHPLPKQRIAAMESKLQAEQNLPQKALNPLVFQRIKAKFEAFTKSSGYILRKYSYQDHEAAQYALALSHALEGKIESSIQKLNNFSPDSYGKPFHLQALGMLYQDLSQHQKAQDYFNQAVELRPDLPLLRLSKARNSIILQDFGQAIEDLTIVSHSQPQWSSVFKQLGIAYGKQGNLFESHYNLAKEALLKKAKQDAEIHIQIAESHMEESNSKHQQKIKELKQSPILEKKT